MHKSQKNQSGLSTMFYKPPSESKLIRSGYLLKSPPEKKTKTEKSWKRRYFVLSKIHDGEHKLKYFKSKEETEKSIGDIELSNIVMLSPRPQDHQKWSWIQATFKCSPSCVLYIKTNNRDYILIGETSEEVKGWSSDLFDALKKQPNKVERCEDIYRTTATIEIDSKAVAWKINSITMTEKQEPKLRSKSDPSSNAVENDAKKPKHTQQDHMSCCLLPGRPDGDHSQKASAPLPGALYLCPKSFLKQDEVNHVRSSRRQSLDSLYESMNEINGIRLDNTVSKVCTFKGLEAEKPSNGTLMRTIDEAFSKLKTHISETDEVDANNGEDSSSSGDDLPSFPVAISETPNGRTPDKQGSTESLDDMNPEERDIEIKCADLKKHLSITVVEGKPCVSGWTGQPQSVCLFHKGDQILAINDLHVSSVEEFNMYLSKSLKNAVKLTILRLHGGTPLHSPNCLCSDTTVD